MKFVITGAAGNVSRPLTEKLLQAGHTVTVIGRNPEHIKPLTDQGANAAIGSFEDLEFLKKTFTGADAVYTMLSPPFSAQDMKAYMGQIGKNYAEAIKASAVKYIVNLSSVGAHNSDGCGPVSGLYRVEQTLNELKDVNIKHLRPVYFFNNFLSSVAMVKNMNIIGANFGGPGFKMPLVNPAEIADFAFEELSALKFSGHSHRYIAGDERTTDEIASVLGAAVGKPHLPWIVFSDEQAYDGMKQMGLPEEFAKNYVEMGHAIHTGKLMEDYWKNQPAVFCKTKLEDFAKTFAAAYYAN
jgi:uncharacterized protein YbjT (DUF2867 family)